MKHYIRTKDGRILDFNRIKLYAASYSFNNQSETHLSIEWDVIREEIDILKQANTIEELCDEAVFFDKDNKPHYKSQESNIWYLGASLFIETLRFGIFTDKGLIYVAKMNDKEELELL